MSNVETTDISSLPRERVVIMISSLKENIANLRYTYDKECQRRQRLYERLSNTMGDVKPFAFDAYRFARGYPFVTNEERAKVIGVIESVVATIGNAEYNEKRRKCASLNTEYQACKQFCIRVKDVIKTMESNMQMLKERLVELDKK